MASESCSTSSSSFGDDFFPIFLLRKSYDVIPQNLRQEAEYNTVDETDAAAAAAEAQFDENESDPGLDLCPPASRVGKTFWCQCGESVWCQCGDRHAPVVLIVSSVWKSSLSVEELHVDLQLSRSTCQCFQASWPHSVTCSWTALTGFLDMTKRPLKCLTQQQVSGKTLVFLRLRFFPPSMDRSVTIVCIFSTHFSVKVAEQPPNKRH